MSKKTVRIISTIITIAMVVMFSTSVVFADTITIGGVNITPNTNTNGSENVTKIGDNILGIIRIVGTIISVGVVMILGIKYMMGSAEEKASYKKTMVPYIVGAILLFAASNLAGYIYSFTEGL